jgi:hypothetical protein
MYLLIVPLGSCRSQSGTSVAACPLAGTCGTRGFGFAAVLSPSSYSNQSVDVFLRSSGPLMSPFVAAYRTNASPLRAEFAVADELLEVRLELLLAAFA